MDGLDGMGEQEGSVLSLTSPVKWGILKAVESSIKD